MFDDSGHPYYNDGMENREIEKTLAMFRLPAYNEIPDVGLYLEQVAKFINTYLSIFPQMEVTPSMISNYAKQKLFQRVNKKTYSREQIAVILFIVLTKTVLSIDQIRILLNNFAEDGGSIEETYSSYARDLQNMLQSFSDRNGPGIDTGASQKELMRRNIVNALAYKMYLQCFFETYEIQKES